MLAGGRRWPDGPQIVVGAAGGCCRAVPGSAACGAPATPPGQSGHATIAPPKIAYANIGDYLLAYECAGTGRFTVILEAGYTASGIGTYGPHDCAALARRTRVCTYDRAGDGLSDARPASVRPLTGATQARELHTLLAVIGARPRYVLVGHSYGGLITREFAALYPGEVAGMVLVDASSEPEVAVYNRLHAGPWIDGTVHPRRTSGSTSAPQCASWSARPAWRRCR